jgi:hypothetical protein
MNSKPNMAIETVEKLSLALSPCFPIRNLRYTQTAAYESSICISMP